MSSTFKDNAGRLWTVTVDVNAIKRARAIAGIDLMTIIEGQVLERLARDPIALVDTIYAVCKPEADAKGVTDEMFGAAMVGDVIEAAGMALLEELVRFFPNQKDRENLKTLLDLTHKLQEKARATIAHSLANGEIERKAEELLQSSGASSGPAPGS